VTREEINTKLKALITCMKCEVSGKPCDDNCPTQYEAGHTGEIIENLEAISKLLEQEPCEDCISRQAVFELIDFYDGQNQQHFTVDNLRDDVENVLPVIPKGVTITDFADKCRECGREKVLDKIRAEIDHVTEIHSDGEFYIKNIDVKQIINKYKAESEG